MSETVKSIFTWAGLFFMIVGAAEVLSGLYSGGDNWFLGIIMLVISIVIFSTVKHKDNVTKDNKSSLR